MRLLLWLSQLIKLPQFKCRALTPGEIQLCRQVFADLIDFDQVRIMNHPFLPWQPTYMLMAPRGYIHVRNRHYKTDYSLESLSHRGLFIHEMTHVLQFQQGQQVFLKGALLQSAYYLSLKRYNPYHYQLKPGKAFTAYNIEQQGDIARDIFFGKIPNLIQNTP